MPDYMPLIDNHAAVRPGEAIRLFPFGKLHKGGNVREITPEVARQFKLPDFKAPIKLGSHADETPAGGFIVGLEVRADGLYGLTEFTDKGAQAFMDGDYRYHSPEVIWEGAMEKASDGSLIEGPLIVGTALLHTPHLGEAAALYEAEPVMEENMSTAEDMVSVPKTWYEKALSWFDREPEPAPEPTPEPAQTEEYTAALAERDEYRAKIEQMEAEAALSARVEKYEAELDETKVAGLEGAAEMLAGMTDEQAEWTLKNLRALSEQVDGSLESDLGAAGDDEPVAVGEKFHAAVQAYAKENEIPYQKAVDAVAEQKPELYAAWIRGR